MNPVRRLICVGFMLRFTPELIDGVDGTVAITWSVEREKTVQEPT